MNIGKEVMFCGCGTCSKPFERDTLSHHQGFGADAYSIPYSRTCGKYPADRNIHSGTDTYFCAEAYKYFSGTDDSGKLDPH